MPDEENFSKAGKKVVVAWNLVKIPLGFQFIIP
jgi:hypothetical protein